MGSKFIEGHIRLQEAILGSVRDLITDKGETNEEVQQVINDALDELGGWYEMREMFS
ncbi:hypothetical protein [Spirosoma sordidisoli]|uniref:hypothetical protein n=1 Tax=Spirosoma sordidisoli TaxID=2502893 RepID=UPI0013ECB331|nr:hypothetical protein [Spirosoma sordidisoli]